MSWFKKIFSQDNSGKSESQCGNREISQEEMDQIIFETAKSIASTIQLPDIDLISAKDYDLGSLLKEATQIKKEKGVEFAFHFLRDLVVKYPLEDGEIVEVLKKAIPYSFKSKSISKADVIAYIESLRDKRVTSKYGQSCLNQIIGDVRLKEKDFAGAYSAYGEAISSMPETESNYYLKLSEYYSCLSETANENAKDELYLYYITMHLACVNVWDIETGFISNFSSFRFSKENFLGPENSFLDEGHNFKMSLENIYGENNFREVVNQIYDVLFEQLPKKFKDIVPDHYFKSDSSSLPTIRFSKEIDKSFISLREIDDLVKGLFRHLESRLLQ